MRIASRSWPVLENAPRGRDRPSGFAVAAAGLANLAAVALAAGGGLPDDPLAALLLVLVALVLAGAGVAALVGLLAPWTLLVMQARAQRARAEERVDLGAHLHDVVLQELMLIQRRAHDADEVQRLARRTERGLRAWLSGSAGDRNDLASALVAAVEEVEDRFAVAVELVTVGTCALDKRTDAVVGAVSEALTNAAKHAGVRRMSVFAEAGADEVFVLVRDRGRGFDQATGVGRDRRGVSDSIVGRMRRRGGTALVTSAVGQGTEVELRLPLRVPT